MHDILSLVSTLRRPKILIRAARIGMENYRRGPHLARVIGHGVLPRHGQALVQLMDIEGVLNEQRQNNDAGYSVVRHVDAMIALMGEAQLFRASRL